MEHTTFYYAALTTIYTISLVEAFKGKWKANILLMIFVASNIAIYQFYNTDLETVIQLQDLLVKMALGICIFMKGLEIFMSKKETQKNNSRKKPILLLLSWRDYLHPASGGAEVFTTEMLRRCDIKNRFRIIHFSTETEGVEKFTRDEGILYIKKGNWLSVLFYAIAFYFKNANRIQFVVDQCNTHRFFTPLWVPRRKIVFFIHQMTREIWKMKLPFPFGNLGEATEDLLLSPYTQIDTMTVSPSTKSDLEAAGFQKSVVKIIPEGVAHAPIPLPLPRKSDQNLFIYVGRYSEYKGLPDAIRAFGQFLKTDPSAQLYIIGSKNEKYIESDLTPLCEALNIPINMNLDSTAPGSVTLTGRVSEEKKLELMQEATALIYPSKREGWGLSVSEAANLGTPSIVYNSPGLIDAVNQGQAGYLCESNDHNAIHQHMCAIANDPKTYQETRVKAYNFSKVLTWQSTADAFDNFIQEKISA